MPRGEGRQPRTVLVLYGLEAWELERGQEEFERFPDTEPQGAPRAKERPRGTGAWLCWQAGLAYSSKPLLGKLQEDEVKSRSQCCK